MLELARFFHFWFSYDDPQSIVVMARTIMALFGAGLAVMVMLLGRRWIDPLAGVLAGVSTAVVPIVCVHAH